MMCYVTLSLVAKIKLCCPPYQILLVQTQSAWLAKGIITLHFLAKIKKHEIVSGDKGCHLVEKLS